MLRGGEHRHIHANFRDDTNCGKGLDTWSRCNNIELGKIFFSGSQNQRLQVEPAQFQGIHVGTNDAELFSLFSTHLPVHSGLDFRYRSFDTFGEIWGHIKGFAAFQQPGRDGSSRFAKNIGEHIVQLNVGDRQAVLGTVFLPGSKAGQFPMVTHQIPKLADICRRDKAAGYQIVFEDVGDPLGVLPIRFLSPNCLDVFRMGQDDSAGSFQMVSIKNSELVIDKRRRRVFWEGQEVVLPRKQFDILFYLASHAGEVVTKSMLYQQVWKEEYDLNADEAVKEPNQKAAPEVGCCRQLQNYRNSLGGRLSSERVTYRGFVESNRQNPRKGP